MVHKQKLSKYFTSIILGLAAVLMISCTEGLLLYSKIISTIYCSFPLKGGYAVPMRVVGINLPYTAFIWLGISFVILIFIIFLLVKRKGISSRLFWVNGIFSAVILSHIIMWISMIFPAP